MNIKLAAITALATAAYGQPVAEKVTFSGLQATSTFSWSHTVGTGTNRALVVLVTERDNSVSSIAYGAVNLVRVIACNDPNYTGAYQVEAWTLPAGTQPASGVGTVTVKLTGVSRLASAEAVSMTGVDQAATVDASACHETAYPNQLIADSVSLTTTVAKDYVLASALLPNIQNGPSLTGWPGTVDQTYANSSFDFSVYSHLIATMAGPATYGWTWTNGTSDGVLAVAIKNAAAPPPPPTGTVSYLQGTSAARPSACPATGLVFYVATDGNTPLTWCISSQPWLSAAAAPAVMACTGSGTGWDCGGMLAVSTVKSDGTPVTVVGVATALPSAAGLSWSPQ